MKYLVKAQLYALTALVMLASVSQGATIVPSPSQLPKGAYVNGGDGDQHFFQSFVITLDEAVGAWANGNTIVITLPSDIAVADPNRDASRADGIYLSVTSGAAIGAAATSTLANNVTITLATGGAAAPGDVIMVVFPIETDSIPSESTVDYSFDFQAGVEANDQELVSVTFQDTLTIATFAASFTGYDSTSALGRFYPDAAADFTAALPDIVSDQSGGVSSENTTTTRTDNWAGFGGADADLTTVVDNLLDNDVGQTYEATYYLWASMTPALKKIDSQTGTELLDWDVNTTLPLGYATPKLYVGDIEGATFKDVAASDITTDTRPGQISTYNLDEGAWYFYLTTSLSSDWVVAMSDTVEVHHYPAFDVSTSNAGGGLDYDNSETYDPAGADDVVEMTLESGGTLDVDGDLVLTDASLNADTVKIFWQFEDLDDDATMQIFLSENSGYTVEDIVTSDAYPDLTVTGLGTDGILITPAPIQEESPVDYYTYDIYTGISDYALAGDYTVYLVSNDGKHQQIHKVVNSAAADLMLYVKHFPYIKFEDPYFAAGPPPPVTIETSTDQYFVINWGGTVDGDKDADGNATINLYYTVGAAGVADLAQILVDAGGVTPIDPLAVAELEAVGTLIGTISEDPDDPKDNRYMWDIRAADLTAATDHWLIAHIQDGVDNLLVQYSATGGPDPTPDANRNIQVTHGSYFRTETPVEGETVELTGSDRLMLNWDGFDYDAVNPGLVQAFIIPQGATPPVAWSTDLGATDGWYWIMGTADNGATAAAGAGTPMSSGKFVLDVSTITDDAGVAAGRPNGFYDVYYFYTFAAAFAAEVPVKADGILRFDGSASADASFELSPNQIVFSKGDTITVSVIADNPGTDNISMVAVSLDIPSEYFDIVPQTGGVPFIDNSNFIGSDILSNSLVTAAGVHELTWVEVQTTPAQNLATAISVVSFEVAVKKASSGTEFIDNYVDFTRTDTRKTDLLDLNGSTIATTVLSPAGNLRLATPGSIAGQVDLEAQADVGKEVIFYVTKPGSFDPITDADYLLANGPAESDGGVKVVLGTDGAYELQAVPTGDYDVAVHRDGYINRIDENVAVRPLSSAPVDFLGFNFLYGGDVAGYDHDGDPTNYSLPDNRIETADLEAVSNDFYPATPASPYTDIDGDGMVYIIDYNLVTTNSTVDVGQGAGNGEGLLYKEPVKDDTNEDVITRLLAGIDGNIIAGTEIPYTVTVENLSSIHAYAVELAVNTDEWELVSYSDGLQAHAAALEFYKINGYDLTLASGIAGRSVVRQEELEMATVTLRALVSDPEAPAVSDVTIVDGNGVASKAVVASPEALPEEFFLGQNFPNPFNPTTNISFGLPQSGNVKLVVYNLLGKELRTITAGTMEAGKYNVVWNSLDNMGRKVGTGIYFYRLMVDSHTMATKKMLLMK